MTINDIQATSLSRRWRVARRVIVVAGILFIGLASTGTLAIPYAVISFAIVALAAFVTPSRLDGDHDPVPVAVATPLQDPLYAVIAGLADAAIAIDRSGRVLALNERARNVAPALRQGEPVSLALRMPALTEALARALASDQEQRAEYSERGPRDRWYEVIVMPVRRQLDLGRPELLLMTLRDLTPLRRADSMRADFVANASHELRTPLAALSGFIETLQGPARDDVKARDRFLAIMKEQAQRMARLIDDLLSLSRIELNAHRRPDTPVDVVPIVRHVVDGLQTLARDRGVSVNVEAVKSLTVLGDRDELVRVFENLVENALKYGAAGKRVDIKCVRTAEERNMESKIDTKVDVAAEAQVHVRDYGPGIAPEHLPRLTERFYRVDVAESRAQGGTGLGLALVKHILNRHRGRLTIESTAGEGATFVAHLPLAGKGQTISVFQ